MLPTPCTSHVSFDTIYEPSEDSYLFLDTLSSAPESAFLSARFAAPTAPLVVEVGTGSGVVLGFVAGNSQVIFSRRDVLTLGTDVNRNACVATKETVEKAVAERQVDTPTPASTDAESKSTAKTIHISSVMGDLATSLRPGSVDVLLFNPPYVPTEDLPAIPSTTSQDAVQEASLSRSERFDRDSYFLSLTYAGGKDGMETTDRLLDGIPEVLEAERGVAYVLLCAQNRPVEVMERVRAWGGGWKAEVVGKSGMQAGWEKLVIVRIWR